MASSRGAADVLRHHLDQVQHVIAASDEVQRSDSQQKECPVKSFPFSQNNASSKTPAHCIPAKVRWDFSDTDSNLASGVFEGVMIHFQVRIILVISF